MPNKSRSDKKNPIWMFMECPSSEWHSSRNPVRSYLTKWFFWTDPVWFISCSFKNVWQTKTITVLWYFTRNLDVLICSMCVFDYRWFGSYRSIVCSRLSRAARRWPSRSRTSSRWSAPLSGPPWFQRSFERSEDIIRSAEQENASARSHGNARDSVSAHSSKVSAFINHNHEILYL